MYKLTEEDLKTLKLFSYYVQSYGEKECDLTVDFYECSQDYTPNVWYSYSHTQIEGYDKISELIDRIAESLELEDYMEDCENHANVTFNLDAKERKLFIRVHEQVRSENEMGTVFEDDDFDNSIKEFMSQLKDDGFNSSYVTFEGGGDSGYIESNLITDDGNSIGLPSGVEDFLYYKLQNFYGGWEINEGSHGQFNFYPIENKIGLDFYEHTESMDDRGTIHYYEF